MSFVFTNKTLVLVTKTTALMLQITFIVYIFRHFLISNQDQAKTTALVIQIIQLVAISKSPSINVYLKAKYWHLYCK